MSKTLRRLAVAKSEKTEITTHSNVEIELTWLKSLSVNSSCADWIIRGEIQSTPVAESRLCKSPPVANHTIVAVADRRSRKSLFACTGIAGGLETLQTFTALAGTTSVLHNTQ
ncbi:hypothetical protein U1Q18_006096 [Sarracenia purpurea var. burkii]